MRDGKGEAVTRLPGSSVVAAIDKYTGTTESCGGKVTAESCGGKRMVRPPSQEESTMTLDLTSFYCFSGHITLRMVLIYYALVHCR